MSRRQAFVAGLTWRSTYVSAAAVIPITRAYIVATQRIVVVFSLALNTLLWWHWFSSRGVATAVSGGVAHFLSLEESLKFVF